MSPRVSVIVPTYNSAWCVGRTIQSVLHQTMADFELIIVNDGSTDDLGTVLAPFLASDSRIRVVDQENSGLAAARNRGVREARAPLVAPLDADDLWHPDYLAELISVLDRHGDAPFAFAYSFRMDADDYLFPYAIPGKAPRHDLIGLLSLNSVGCGSAAVYRRADMLKVGGYDQAMRGQGLEGAEDWKMILRLARLGEPRLVERHLVGYRLVDQSMSQRDPERQFRAVLAVIDATRREMTDVPPRYFADARTMMTAWLLPAFARRRQYRRFIQEAFNGYARNPLWFTNPSVRRTHILKFMNLLGAVRQLLASRPRPHLSTAQFDGRVVFAYLAPPVTAPSARKGQS